MRNDRQDAWGHLAARARGCPADARDTSAPAWFAARVAARWVAGETPGGMDPMIEALSLRCVAIALAVAAVCVAVNLDLVREPLPLLEAHLDGIAEISGEP